MFEAHDREHAAYDGLRLPPFNVGPLGHICFIPDVGRAEPSGSMAAWLRQHAPASVATTAPYCMLGIARTTGTAIRRRPVEHYAAVLAQLQKCANCEASHYIERAMLYLFASV